MLLIDDLRRARVVPTDSIECYEVSRCAALPLSHPIECSELPPCAPLTEQCWLEFDLAVLPTTELGAIRFCMADRWGGWLTNMRPAGAPRTLLCDSPFGPVDRVVGWTLSLSLYGALRHRVWPLRLAILRIVLGQDGGVMMLECDASPEWVGRLKRMLPSLGPSGPPDAAHTAMLIGRQMGLALLFSYGCLHSVLVGQRKAEPPRQQRRAAERAGHPPLLSYVVAEPDGLTARLRSEGLTLGVGLGKALAPLRNLFSQEGALPRLDTVERVWRP